MYFTVDSVPISHLLDFFKDSASTMKRAKRYNSTKNRWSSKILYIFTNHSLQISPKQFNFQAEIVQKYYLMDFETENKVTYMMEWFCMRRNIVIFNF